MKLEDKFFKSFFYPFLISAFLSSLVIIIIILFFTNNKLFKRTSENIINLEKKYSKKILNSVNIIITTKFLKFQSSLNEIILNYQKKANELLQSNPNKEYELNFLKCLLTLDDYFCDDNSEEAAKSAYWLLDDVTTDDDLDENIEVKRQLITYNNIIQNVDSVLEATKPHANSYTFYFENTELYIFYPIIKECEYYFIYFLREPLYEMLNTQCLDENGEYYTLYRVKCEIFFKNMMKSKTEAFDNNYLSNQNKTIFLLNFFDSAEYEYDLFAEREFRMCIEFDDPITEGKGYACVDGLFTDIISPLEDFNSKINGYFFISNVGYNNFFYFPQGAGELKSSTEQIYKWDLDSKLSEKIYFHENIRKILSSNYLDYIGDSLNDEIFVNGKNSNGQYFYINKEKFKYSIYPVILENLKGKKEHILSLIYVYNEQLYLQEMENYESNVIIKILLELLIFIIFGYGLLYIIYLTFNMLAKYIVVPIKNVNYMLKGINIGGNDRLEYLKYLKKKQDENIEKLSKALLLENKRNNEPKEEANIDSEDISKNDYQFNDNDLLTKTNIKENDDSINKKINTYQDYNKKYDEESRHIEKEVSFYDFDDQLLQYRPSEIENLVKSLIDLKTALALTSTDGEIDQIINYSYSGKIFRNFQNMEGTIICQSNIGNLQSQLSKFDKAIYHLALSLHDNKLQKFLNQNLSDELDEGNSLLIKISNTYNENKKKEKTNILTQKQEHNAKNNFSQKLIGILINTRYPKLIYAYYMFFKNIQKLKNSNGDTISSHFMNISFHTINYYNKILIQFIYLSYIKNDFVKIGESILNYIEFLIKFKFKTLPDDKYLLKIHYRNRPEFKEKQDYKKKIFDKIISWFNLFDNYVSYIKENSSLTDSKCIVDDYTHNLNSDNFEFNLESQTVFMFRVNIQKSIFLKGKFCLYCKNYDDALFYFINAAKKKSIVTDGLIKKKSLKHIYKLMKKMNKKYEKYGLKSLNMNKELGNTKKEINKISNQKNFIRKISNREEKFKNIEIITFGEELKNIKEIILQDISECNAKQEKDTIILIDFNIYNKNEYNSSTKTYKIDAFIDETILILNNYLSSSDRLGVLIYSNSYQIICPLMPVNKIDNKNFSKDLIYNKNKIFNKKNVVEEFNSNEYDFKKDGIEFNINKYISSENSQEESLEIEDKEEIYYDKIKGLVKSINYLNTYSKMKESVKNEKFIILFTDLLNMQSIEDKQIQKFLVDLRGDKTIIFLLVGKNKKFKIKRSSMNLNLSDKKTEELFLDKFGEKSEIIYFENMKKIKAILSNNKVIKDEIFYPNEIYK